jgi:cytochrome c556
MKTFAMTALLTACVVAQAGAQTPALERVMRQKLVDAQGVMAAVVTSNWTELERRSRALSKTTEDPAWLVLRTPEYAKQSEAFIRAIDDLVDAATRRDQDAAPVAYMAVTLRCVQCHRYVARARIAGTTR